MERKKKDRAKRKGNIPIQSGIKKESKCFFYKKKGHMKKDYSKFKIWLDKKGTQFSFVCYESYMVNVNHNTWWIDSGSTIHVSNTLQGMQNLRKPVGSEQCIYSSSKMSSRVATPELGLVGGSKPKPWGHPAEAIYKIRLSNTFHYQIFAKAISI